MFWRYLLLICVVALFTVCVWFRNGHQLGNAEGGLPFNNLQKHADMFSWAWADGDMGNTTGYLVASYPTYWFLYQLDRIQIAPYLIEAGTFWTIFVLSGVGIFLIAKKILELDDSFAIVAVFFYWTCPYVLVNVWQRFLYNHIFFLALLPLAMFFFIRGLQLKRYAYAFYTVLVTLILSYALTALALTGLLFACFYLAAFYFSLFNFKRNWFFNLKFVLLTTGLFILTHFWWISQLISFATSANYVLSVSNYFSLQGNISGLTELSHRLGNFIDLIQFQHYSFYHDNASIWSSIYISKKAEIISLILVAITVGGTYFSRKNKAGLLVSLLFLCSLFFSKGNNPPFGEVFNFLFIHVSPFQLFRNPVEKIGILSVFSGSLLFAYSLQSLWRKAPKKLSYYLNDHNYLAFFACAFLAVFWGMPLFTGLVFTYSTNPYGKIGTYEVEVPAYYQQAEESIKKDPTVLRFLALPFLGEGVTYNWPIPYSGVDLYSTLFSKQNVALNTTVPFFSDVVSYLVKEQLSSRLARFLPFLAMSDVILRKDLDLQSRSFPNPEMVEKNLNDLVTEGILFRKQIFGDLTVYGVSPDFDWGKIYMTGDITFTDEKDLSKLAETESDISRKRVYIPLDFYSQIQIPNSEIKIYPDHVLQFNQLNDYLELSTADLYAKLLYVSHSPDEFIYPFVRSKEYLASFFFIDYPHWVLYNTNLLGKRAVEICKYDSSQNPSAEQVLIDKYKNDLYNLQIPIEKVIKGEYPEKDALIDSLLTQSVLLSRCGKISFTDFKDLFVDLKLLPHQSSGKLEKNNLTEITYTVPVSQEYNWHASFDISDKIQSTNSALLKKSTDPQKAYLPQGQIFLSLPENNAYDMQIVTKKSQIPIVGEDIVSQVPVNDYDTEYEVSFNYQTTDGDFFGVYVQGDNDTQVSPQHFEGLALSKLTRHFEFSITPAVGTTALKIGFTGNKNKFCYQDCSRHINQLKALVSDFSVVKKKRTDPYFTYGDKNNSVSSSATWEKISPVEYRVKVHKTTNNPEFLVFSEVFAPGWNVQRDDGSFFSQTDHYLVNGFANGWVIRNPGEQEFAIRYTGEQLLEVAEKISVVSIGLIFLGIFLAKKYES